MSRAALIDTTKCIGCRACQVACKQENNLPAEKTSFFAQEGGYQNPAALSSNTFSLVTFFEITKGEDLKWVFAKRQCMHCQDPSCASACIVGALQRTKDGSVIYDKDKCIGCRYCMVACPFGVPAFEWDKLVPFIKKCTFCNDRTANNTAPRLNDKPLDKAASQRHVTGQTQPACSKVCPTGAIKFGKRDDLLNEAHTRIDENPGKYVHHVYGEKEAGGTGWLYISNVNFNELGFPTNIGNHSYPAYTKTAMQAVPGIVAGVGALLGGVFWFTRRKNTVAETTSGKEG